LATRDASARRELGTHLKYYDGGPAKAAWRRDVLLSLPRDRWGRVTSGALREWRQAQAGERAHASSPRPTREELELAAEIDAFMGKIDRLMRAGAPEELWAPVLEHLDALAADVEQILANVG
jgi:hypothetical protein